MPNAYNKKVLRIDLSRGAVSVDEPDDDFYRTYIGGSGFVGYYLLNELKGGEDPLGPDNILIFATGPLTGTPLPGASRNSVGAKSPLTNGYGESDVGGFWGAELKHAGYDAIIVQGSSDHPVYLWIQDGKAELRDARHLWGKTTGESQKIIQEELGDEAIRVAQTGIAGENMVRYACVLNDVRHAAGRTGMGAVMGSKKLRAIAIRGHRKELALGDADAFNSLARRMIDDLKTDPGATNLGAHGTANAVMFQNAVGGLPTRNFREGVFEGADKIGAKAMEETILVGRAGCYACPVRCKREVAASGPYDVDRLYGGPEYETLGALGSNCGIDDLKAIARGNQLCNAYGLDTISTGDSIAFAMECFEQGVLTDRDTGGLRLTFGNVEAMLKLVEMIARREGLGKVLGEGVARASKVLGKGAQAFALHVKGQEPPLHDPRWKPGMGVGYAVSPTGADHCHNIHDSGYAMRISEGLKALGILKPLRLQDLGPAKIRLLVYGSLWQHTLNCLVFCLMTPNRPDRLAELVRSATGWNTTAWELMKAGERSAVMGRAFDVREGMTRADDCLPDRFFDPLTSGPLKGVAINRAEFGQALQTYYGMMGWDDNGVPTPAKLGELAIEWVGQATQQVKGH